MKTFQQQFGECSDEGFHKPGDLKTFRDHPELLPPPWHKVYKNIVEAMDKNPDEGMVPILCLRFGGECHSHHPDCKKLRGITE